MIDDGHIIQIVPEGSYRGEPVANVWHYVVDEAPVGLPPFLDFIQAWIDLVLAAVTAAQATDHFFNTVRATDLSDLTSDIEVAGSWGGLINNSSSELSMSPQAVLAVTQYGNSKITRPGQKRFSGMVETAWHLGGVVDPSNVATYDAFGDLALACASAVSWDGSAFSMVKMGIEDPADSHLIPIILGVDENGDKDLGRWQAVYNAQYKNAISTQNTRKYGR